MKGFALIIGNSNYEQADNSLKNPENDAVDFSDVLRKLGFVVRKVVNANLQDMDTEIDKFGKELDSYDIGIFYFAGHGMQIRGENFITATNTNFESEVSAQYSSVTLNKVLAYMERARNDTNILILDACRNNPFERSWNRGIDQQGLAPMYAPKGTLIAYATSPGEKASDGKGRNGLYTSALLKHIEDESVSVEELFKRIRNSVYAFSNGKQTTWEHTSLTGTFKFNAGQMVHASDTPYSKEAIEDSKYELEEGDDIQTTIDALKSHNWYTQQAAIDNIINLPLKGHDKNDLFVLGRNMLQTAEGGEHSANKIMQGLKDYLDKIDEVAADHILRGILFEIFFNSDGQFRYNKIKNSQLADVYKLERTKNYRGAFDFIKTQLKPFEETMFFIPGSNQDKVSLDIIVEKVKHPKGGDHFVVKDIKHEGSSVLKSDQRNSFFGSNDDLYYEYLNTSRLHHKLSELASIPPNKLVLAYSESIPQSVPIGFPLGNIITKEKTKPNNR